MNAVDEKADGAAGARFAAALLGVAVCAETSHTTMDEDGAKLDLRLSLRHAFNPNVLITAHCQVKSGRSYLLSSTKTDLKVGANSKTLETLRLGTPPTLLVWVPPKPASRVYWHIVSPQIPKKKTHVIVPKQNFITPSLRYDLSRASTHSHHKQSVPRRDVRKLDDAGVTRAARAAYEDLKSQSFQHPLVGHLKVTRFAWRHVTRASKAKQLRIMSLRAVPYLRHFLGVESDRYLVADTEREVSGAWTSERRNILLWYDNALRINDEAYSLLLRVREEVRYPSNWAARGLSVKDVQHSATLVSWWCKK